MKVLFVASGNKKGAGQVSSFVQSQFDSLKAEGLEMVLFPVKGRGWRGYAKAVVALRRLIKRERPDIIHAHYSTCGFVASLACIGLRQRPKILVSILGSFPKKGAKWRRVRWAIRHVWDGALVKSERTRKQLGLELPVIPNGVNLEIFQEKSRDDSRKALGWNEETKYVIWCSDPERVEKNWPLAVEGIRVLVNEGVSVELVAVYNKTPEEVCTYMNAADCLLLTSVSEGSPNVIKEAMACGCPIVTTDVGDVRERLANLDGCYVVEEPMAIDAEHLDAARLDSKNFDAGHTDAMRLEKTRRVSAALEKALEFGKRTEGRKRIIDDGLTVAQNAKKIIKWYNE